MIQIQPGDKIGFAEERNSYTVQAVSSDGRWAVCTKEFAACDTVIYTVIDFQDGVRGRDDHHGLGYETRDQCERACALFEAGEAAHSHRHQPITLNITRWKQGAVVAASTGDTTEVPGDR